MVSACARWCRWPRKRTRTTHHRMGMEERRNSVSETRAQILAFLTLTRWVRLVPSLRGTGCGTLFSASSRDYGNLLLPNLATRKDPEKNSLIARGRAEQGPAPARSQCLAGNLAHRARGRKKKY